MPHTIFGQIVVGPPGSGKSTYCKFICENLKQLGRNAKIVNLDPANDCLPYKPVINLMEFIDVETVMEQNQCGPNGAMIHCIETLNKNFGWLYDKIVILIEAEMKKFESLQENLKSSAEDEKGSEEAPNDPLRNRPYIIFDCPGQSEIFTHNTAMRDIIKKLTTTRQHFDLRLVCMNLCDAYHSNDIGKYIGLVMNSLSTMMNLELPHVNVFSKVDILERYGKTRFNLEFYCEVLDLNYLLETDLENPFFEKYRNLTKALVGVIEDNSYVSFVPLNIQQAEDIHRVLQLADRAIGYYIDDLDLAILQTNPQLMELASGKRIESLNDATVQL